MPNKYAFNATRGTIDSDVVDLLQTWEDATISAGSIAFSGSSMTVDTQGSAATDDLDTITASNVLAGYIAWLRPASASRKVVLKHNTGNLWLHGKDFVLDHPRRIVLLLWDGAYWVLIGSGGQAATPTEVIPDSGENTLCVVAGRLAQYVDYIITQAAEARAGGLIAVVAAVTAAIKLAEPDADQNLINALANDIVATYADDTAIYSAFTTTVFDRFQCGAFCAASSGSGTSEFSESDIPVLKAYLGYYTGAPYDIIADIIDIIGADGLTRAVGLSVLEATTLDCDGGGGCVCSYTFEWESASSPTKRGCTVLVDVVLHIDGGATLPASVDVDITFGGTATGGGSDYTAVDTSVTFPAGSADGDTQTVEITITSGISAGETIVLGLDPSSGEVGDVATHTVTAVAGNCSDPWSVTFLFGTSNNGLDGWTLVQGTEIAAGIQVELGTGADRWVDLQRVLDLSSSTVVTEVRLRYYSFSPALDAQIIYTNGNNNGGDIGCNPNGITWCTRSGLSYTHETLTIQLYYYDQYSGGYLSQAYVAGTGVNPFTGT